MKANPQRKNCVPDIAKVVQEKKRQGTRTETETIHKALDLTADEAALAKTLKELLDKGKGHIVEVFGTRS